MSNDDFLKDDDIDFGPCCACGGTDNVRNIIMLDVKASKPGTGWGCAICHLPSDGAMAVLCDECIKNKAEIRFACDGYLAGKQRIEISKLSGEHKHNLKYRHYEDQPSWLSVKPKGSAFKPGAEEKIKWFSDSPEAGDPDCICSWCSELISELDFPLRLFADDNTEARMHPRCWNEAMVHQISIFERPEDDYS